MRPEVQSHTMTEGEVLARVLGEDQTGDRLVDLVEAIRRLEDLVKDIPLQFRVLYHATHAQVKAEKNGDAWFYVADLVSTDPQEVRTSAWRATAKNRAWRRGHPRGLETEPPEGSGTSTPEEADVTD